MFRQEKYSLSAFRQLESQFASPPVHQLKENIPHNIRAEVLRLDLIHPFVSGNKWFKLRKHLERMNSEGINHLITFGGAYSNHIDAVAWCAKSMNVSVTGIIRGEKPLQVSHTLQNAASNGMDLIFVSRELYDEPGKQQLITSMKAKYPQAMFIAEGGFDEAGVEGAATILDGLPQPQEYTDILCAVGTSAMMSGLLRAAPSHTNVTGISVMKNNVQLNSDVMKFLPPGQPLPPYSINHEYHFGGYAKKTDKLIQFMNKLYEMENIATDFVYSAKLFYGFYDLLQKDFFPPGSRVLIIHCGGLQGNKSLPAGSLTFPSGH